jgi:hypothetical protein
MSTLTAWFASSSFIYALGGVALAVVVLQGWLVRRLIQALGAAARMEEKLGHFGDALSLLTETTETGFVAIANELNKQSGDSLLSKPKSISNARINAAARRGSSVAEIAASEQLSESEVRLRMHLSKSMTPAPAKAPRSARKPPVRKTGMPSPVSEELVHGALRA